MPLYRCLHPKCPENKGGAAPIFEAESPLCPACKFDAVASGSRVAEFMPRLVTIHLDPQTDFPGIGHGHALCDLELTVGVVARRGEQVTAEPCAVTCPKCKAHPEWPKDAVVGDLSRQPLTLPGRPCGCK